MGSFPSLPVSVQGRSMIQGYVIRPEPLNFGRATADVKGVEESEMPSKGVMVEVFCWRQVPGQLEQVWITQGGSHPAGIRATARRHNFEPPAWREDILRTWRDNAARHMIEIQAW